MNKSLLLNKKPQNNWQEVKLGDVCFYVSQKMDTQSLSIYNYISTENMLPNKSGITNASSLPNISITPSFKKDDILVSNIRPYFKKIWLAQFSGGCSNDVIVFRANKNIGSKFLYYILSDDRFFEYSTQTSKGTKMPRGDKTAILKYAVSLPPLDVQKKIAGVLGALDDKIELNNKINQNLEAQAQALFKSWFVDFEPFGGQMPDDWKIGKLGGICECLLGGTPNRNIPEFWNGNIPWINSGEVNAFRITKPSEYISELGLSKSATKLLPAKTTVIAITGATLGRVSLLEINSCANQSVVGVLPNSNIPYEFIYPFVKHNILELISHQTGGAQQHINKQNVEQIKLYIPPYGILHQYQTSVKPIYKVIANNCFENTRLAELRDTLLPKLMSGEINVDDVKILADKSSFTGEI